MAFKDKKDRVFGRLTVLHRLPNRIIQKPFGKTTKVVWQCRCACGNELPVLADALGSGQTQSCGCYQKDQARKAVRSTPRQGFPSFIDRTGQIVGRLKVLYRLPNGEHKETRWLCICSCGKEYKARAEYLGKRGIVQSCGCYQREQSGKRSRGRPFENAYNTLLHSCQKRRNGLKVELTYADFLGFTESKTCHYCGKQVLWEPYNRQTSNLDRKDNQVGYTLKNCVVCCGTCNKMKRDMGYDEFIAHCCSIGIIWRVPTNAAKETTDRGQRGLGSGLVRTQAQADEEVHPDRS